MWENREHKRTSVAQSSVSESRETVLVCVTGMSPAIITETAWALAHEKPPVRPNRIIAFATSKSRESVVKELLESGVWEKLRRVLKARENEFIFSDTGDHIRVFTRRGKELEDLRTAADNDSAADFILEHLRGLTENPDIRIIASIAGGRKTMGALLYACMSLIGRDDDRVTHVLVSEELEKRQHPKFYFPANNREGKAIQLASVPFVPLRDLFPREWGRMPGTFTAMVAKYGHRIQELVPQLHLTLHRYQPTIRVNDEELKFPPREYLLLLFLAERAKRGEAPIERYKEAQALIEERRQQLVAEQTDAFKDWSSALKDKKVDSEDDIRKLLASIVRKLNQKGRACAALAEKLPHRGSFALHLQPSQITIED